MFASSQHCDLILLRASDISQYGSMEIAITRKESYVLKETISKYRSMSTSLLFLPHTVSHRPQLGTNPFLLHGSRFIRSLPFLMLFWGVRSCRPSSSRGINSSLSDGACRGRGPEEPAGQHPEEDRAEERQAEPTPRSL